MILTPIDKLFEYLSANKKVSLPQIAKDLNWKERSLERVVGILEYAGFLSIRYSINPLGKTQVELKTELKKEESKEPTGKLISEYTVEGKNQDLLAKVEILKGIDIRPTYLIHLPEFTEQTLAYIESVKTDISAATFGEIPEEDIYKSIASKLEQDLPIKKEDMSVICNYILREMYGLGDLDILISDKQLEEIVVNSSESSIAVYHRQFGWLRTNVFVGDEEDISNVSAQIARKIGKQINVLTPILDAHLKTGDRVNATLSPISSAGNTITLRLFSRDPWTVVSFIRSKTFSSELVSLLWQAIHYEMNVIVGGGTGSGKTSSLNSLLALIPSYQRIITIEDTREIVLPKYQWNWIPMVTRTPNPEGLGEVTMLDLVVNSLRMRPDRIIMGEIRRKREAEVLFEAMHTGHSVYGTIHANTGSQIIKRLIEPPIEIPPSEVEDITLVLVQYRDRRSNLRRALEVSEVIPGTETPKINQIYRWRPRTDTFESVKTPNRYYEELNLHTGMTQNEILSDQKDKQEVLEWMLKHNLDNINKVGLVMKNYYSDSSDLINSIHKKYTPQKLFGDELS